MAIDDLAQAFMGLSAGQIQPKDLTEAIRLILDVDRNLNERYASAKGLLGPISSETYTRIGTPTEPTPSNEIYAEPTPTVEPTPAEQPNPPEYNPADQPNPTEPTPNVEPTPTDQPNSTEYNPAEQPNPTEPTPNVEPTPTDQPNPTENNPTQIPITIENFITAVPTTAVPTTAVPTVATTPTPEPTPISTHHAIEALNWLDYMAIIENINGADNSRDQERIDYLNNAVTTLDRVMERATTYMSGRIGPLIEIHLNKVDVLRKLGHNDDAYALLNEDSDLFNNTVPKKDNIQVLKGYLKDNIEAAIIRGDLKYEDTDLDEAERELKFVYSIDPERAREPLAKVYDSRAENTIDPLHVVVESVKEKWDAKWDAGLNKYNEGVNASLARRKDLFTEAKGKFKEVVDALESNEDDEKALKARALHMQASTNMQLGLREDAIKNLEESIKTPTKLAYNCLAQIYRIG